MKTQPPRADSDRAAQRAESPTQTGVAPEARVLSQGADRLRDPLLPAQASLTGKKRLTGVQDQPSKDEDLAAADRPEPLLLAQAAAGGSQSDASGAAGGAAGDVAEVDGAIGAPAVSSVSPLAMLGLLPLAGAGGGGGGGGGSPPAQNAAPLFTSGGGLSSTSVSVSSGTTLVTSVAAQDPESAPITYSIVSGPDQAKFVIDPVTGALSFKTPPDASSPTDVGGNNVYDVVVQASDGTNTSTQTIAVTITNTAPSITSNGGGASASVSVSENTTAVTTVAASDAENGTLTYSISGGADSAKFTINPTTGALSFSSAPDYENPTDNGGNNVYDVVVRVSDGLNTDTQSIAVTVTNVNDSAPSISSNGGGASTAVSINEGTTPVTTVAASDPDGGALTYSISGGADSAKFTVNPSTGALSFTTAPDYENPTDAGGNNTYDVVVRVTDGTNSDTQSIAVTVLNVNDNAPSITTNGGGASASITINENTTPVTVVGANDSDDAALTYSISGGADSAKFTINPTTGALSFASAPDYEIPTDNGANNVYDVIVRASDGTNSDTQSIAVTVVNVNDVAPFLGGESAAFTIAENTTLVTRFVATDTPEADALTYSISGGVDSARFTIDPSTGVLSFVTAPDYENPTDNGSNNVYNLVVQVSDGLNSSQETVTVTVTNVNDSAPSISSNGGGASAAVTVNEGVTSVTTVGASDADGGSLTYSISGGADSAKFSINPTTGALSFASAPDYENPTDNGSNNVYDVVVRVTDGLNSDTQSIAVTVLNLNDNSPSITSNGGGASSAVTINEGTTPVTTVAASDADGGALTYSISGGADSAKFSINPTTGALSFATAPDYENPTDNGGNNVYDVVVRVTDGTNSDTQSIAVTVLNLNDSSPSISSNGGGASASVTINEGATPVTTVAASDPDGGALTYSISGGADSAKFTINPTTGALSFVTAPDYENPTDNGGNNVYDVVIRVSDGTNSDTQSIAVTVLNVNDGVPSITSNGGGASAAITINEGVTPVTTVAASDSDGPSLTYSISGGADSAKFSINPTTGALSFTSAPDYENPTDNGSNNVYDVVIRVSDGTNSDTQSIAVTVLNLNDNSPSITSNGGGASSAVTINEGTTPVTTVAASDPDGGSLTYSISGGADSAKFSINPTTGALSFTTAPDYENPTDNGGNNVYDVVIQVTDGSNTDTQSVAVTVLNVNDNSPSITSNGGGSSSSVTLLEGTTPVTTVAASDPDGGSLTYSISGGPDSAKFTINPTTGALSFVTAPDWEHPTDAGPDNVYDVVVQVSDGTFTDTQTIAVTITNDITDNDWDTNHTVAKGGSITDPNDPGIFGNIDRVEVSNKGGAQKGFEAYQSGNNLVMNLSSGSFTIVDHYNGKPVEYLQFNTGKGTPSYEGYTYSTGLYALSSDSTGPVTGTSEDDILVASTGQVVEAGDGNDLLMSGTTTSGTESMAGGAGSDLIFSGAGADTLVGGTGADWLEGGTGNDAFVWNATGEGGDRLIDFDDGADKLVFENSAFSLANGGTTWTALTQAVTVTVAGGAGTSIAGAQLILWNAGAAGATNNTAAAIDTFLQNQSGTFDGGVFVLAYDSTDANAPALFYDADANSAGGAVLVTSFHNFTKPTDAAAPAVTDFQGI